MNSQSKWHNRYDEEKKIDESIYRQIDRQKDKFSLQLARLAVSCGWLLAAKLLAGY